MGNWLRANLVSILVGLAVLMAVGTVSGWVRAAEHKGVARANAAEAAKERERADSIESVRLRDERADSIRYMALVDSAAARATRAEDARRREALAHERAERARAQAAAAAESLIETLTPAQVPLFRAYERQRDVEVAEVRSELGSVRTRLEDTEAENVSLWQSRESMASLYEQATGELVAVRAENAALRRANDALEAANRSGGLFPDLGDLTKPVYVAIGAGIGYLAGGG